jgi:hypothetical protein
LKVTSSVLRDLISEKVEKNRCWFKTGF